MSLLRQGMHSVEIRRRAIELRPSYPSTAAVARELGVSRAAVREWLCAPQEALAAQRGATCFACSGARCEEPAAYTYLLGQYLGDGCISINRRGIPKLRIACADAYPAIADEVDAAIRGVSGHPVCRVQSVGCSEHASYWMHWPCLFPQHGPGRKHERPIVLVDWQQDLVDEHPWPLIRGLIHSDGCRAINRVTVRGRQYAYPRYFFSNMSPDILAIMGRTLDRVGVAWRFNRHNSISIARRPSVALVDEHVGPKR